MRTKIALLLVLAFIASSTFAQQWGYATLIAPQNSTTVTLIDTNSNVVKTWSGLSGSTAYSCYLMPGGYLWRTVKTTNSSFSGGGLAGRVQKVDWNGTILFDYTISNTNEISHHDICPMPNGNVMLIVYEKKTAAQMTAAGASSSTARQLEKIVELQPTGVNTANIVWQWNLYDHLVQNTNANGANYKSSIVNNPQLLNVNYKVVNDWIHMNGIDYNEALNQVVVSSHNLNEMWVIDHSTTTAEAAGHTGGTHGKGGDFLYRWGNPAAYSATGTTIFNVMHDAHWIPADCPNAGRLVGMNNKGVSSSQSAIDQFETTWNGTTYTHTLGQQYLPTTYTARHPCNGYTSNMGNSQQLPNGNQLVCLATAAKVYEIDGNGTQLWQYQGTGSISQAFRYSKCYIENPSVAIANASPSVCANSNTPLVLSATGVATGVTNFTYQWSPATGLSSTTVANPSVTNLTSPVTYTVTLSTTECTATASVNVAINPAAVANAGNDVSISTGQSTTLTATGGNTYLWSNGANSASTTVSPTATTVYTVTVVNASGCSATDDVQVQVIGGTLTTSAIAANTSVCAGSSTSISATPSGGSGNYSYAWSSVPVGFTSTSSSAVVAPSANTVYTVTVSDGSSTTTASVSIGVNALPSVSAGSNVSIPFGQSTTLQASGAASYVWSNGSTAASQSVSPTANTTYTVTGTDANTCSASASVVVTVSGAPLVVVLSADDSTICRGEATQLFATATGGSGAYTYNWSSLPAGFSSTLYNPYINPNQTLVYTVTVSDGANSITASLTITVLDLPAKPDITVNGNQLTSSSPVNNQWFFYGNPIDDANTQTITADIHGSYQVQVTDANGCASQFSDPYEYFPSGLSDSSEDIALWLFPNPATNSITLRGDALNATFKVTVTDCLGRIAMTIFNQSILDVSSLNAGVYVLKLETPIGQSTHKFIVAK